MMDDDFDFDDLASFDNDANTIGSKRKVQTKRTDSWIAVNQKGIKSSYPNHAAYKDDIRLNQFQLKFYTNSNKTFWPLDTNFKVTIFLIVNLIAMINLKTASVR